jgi:hypothetical protein
MLEMMFFLYLEYSVLGGIQKAIVLPLNALINPTHLE